MRMTDWDAGPYSGPDTTTIDNAPEVPVETTPTAYHGPALPVVYGTARVAPRVVYCKPDGVATLYRRREGQPWEEYEGRAAGVVLAISEAPIAGVLRAFKGGGTPLAQGDLYRLVAKGTSHSVVTNATPAPVSFFLAGRPEYGMAYQGTAYFAAQRFGIDEDGKVPDVAFEVAGRCIGAGGVHAHPADVVLDLLTNPRYGVGLDVNQVVVDQGIDGQGASSYRTYCTAHEFMVSRAITDQEDAASLLGSLLLCTNAEAVWTEGRLVIVPWGDQARGAYAPPATAAVLDESEIIREPGRDPVTVMRVPDSEVFNCWPVNISNREADYTASVFEAEATEHSAFNGLRRAGTVDAPWITEPTIALRLSSILAQRSISQRNRYRFKLKARWALLDQMDYVSLTDSKTGLTNALCRIRTIRKGEDGSLDVEAIEAPLGSATPVDLTPQTEDGFANVVEPLYVSDARADAQAAQAAADAAQAAADAAQAAADAAAGAAAGADAKAAGRNRTFRQATAPLNPTGGYPLCVSDTWVSTDITTACPDTTCTGRARLANGSLPVGAAPHGAANWTHLWNGTAWKDAERPIVAREITAANINANEFKVGYSEDAQGNPTAGVKIFDAAKPLKIGPGGAQVGPYELSAPVVRSLSALAQSSDGQRVWYRGNLSGVQAGNPVLMDAPLRASTTYVYGQRINWGGLVLWCSVPGTSNANVGVYTWSDPYLTSGTAKFMKSDTIASYERLSIMWGNYTGYAAGSNMTLYQFFFTLRPFAPDDNLDALSMLSVDVYDNSGSGGAAAWLCSGVVSMPQRRYGNPMLDPAGVNHSSVQVDMWAPRAPPGATFAEKMGNMWLNVQLYGVAGSTVRVYRSTQTAWTQFASVPSLPGASPPPEPPPPEPGDPPGGTCVTPEMGILMSDGSLKRAGDLREGDFVRTRHETTGEWGDHRIIHASHHSSERVCVVFTNGRGLACSPGHRVSVAGEWREVAGLQPGEVVDGPEPSTVSHLNTIPAGPVVLLTVEDAHTYVADGCLSHNAKKL